DLIFSTAYANARQVLAWVLGLGENARIIGPPELAAEFAERLKLLIDRHTGDPELAAIVEEGSDTGVPADAPDSEDGNGHHPEAAIRPERFARLVTLASILIDAGRAGRRLEADMLCRELGISDQELREDISVLN